MMIALVSRDVVYLKADAETIPSFEREGLAPFSYMAKGGKRTITSYWRMPERREWRVPSGQATCQLTSKVAVEAQSHET